MIVKTSEIPGPPFACPECRENGNTKRFTDRRILGLHRAQAHNVRGTAMSTVARRNALQGIKNKVGRPRKTTHPPTHSILDALMNPSKVVHSIDAAIDAEQLALAQLMMQVGGIQARIDTLRKLREPFAAVTKQPTNQETQPEHMQALAQVS